MNPYIKRALLLFVGIVATALINKWIEDRIQTMLESD